MKFILDSRFSLRQPIIGFLVVCFLVGCTKDEDPPHTTHTFNKGRIGLHLQHFVNEMPLLMDTVMYTTGAGYPYSVTKLFYYLDSFVLISGNTQVLLDGNFFVDARNTPSELLFDSIPSGYYTGIKFSIGIRPRLNISNGLPTTAENLKMVWPDEMGGGYHFLMLEGHYRDTTNKAKGYTFHLGTHQQRVEHNLIPISLNIVDEQIVPLNLGMQINEWYVNPNTYDFAISGNHIMGVDSSMQKIRDNGKDVFRKL